jgi:hypothetical protein
MTLGCFALPTAANRPSNTLSFKRLCVSWLITVAVAGPVGAEGPHDDFDRLLERYVATTGVRYAAWASDEEDRTTLTAYLDRLQRVPASELNQDDALAFWINLYNAATLKLVLDHYPLDSIQDLATDETTPWQRPVVTVEGRTLTLDQIENDIVRPTFGDARVHFALNCAARGCPPLRPTAFEGAGIDRQLERAAVDVVNDPYYVKVECRDGDGGIYLSRIFEWYEQDFVEYADSVQYFLADRRDDRSIILRERCELIYNRYDWSLNEAR